MMKKQASENKFDRATPVKRRLSTDLHFECDNNDNLQVRTRARSRSFERTLHDSSSEVDLKSFLAHTDATSKFARKMGNSQKSMKISKQSYSDYYKDSDIGRTITRSFDLSTSNSLRQSQSRSTFGREASEYASVKMRGAKRSVASFFNPSYNQRKESFLKLFKNKVPLNDEYITDYSCAYQREILMHGRMYVTRRHICFHANIFKWETSLVLSLELVSAITKERTAMVIPNAIQVNLQRGTKHFFTSFGRRDKTYNFLSRLWHANIEHTVPTQLEELISWADGEDAATKMREKNWRLSNSSSTTSESNESKKLEVPTSSLLPSVRSTPDELIDDDDVTPKGTLGREWQQTNSIVMPSNPLLVVATDKILSTSVPRDMNELERKYLQANEADVECRASDEDLNEYCRCEVHEGTLVLSKTLNLSVEQLFLLLFTDTSFTRDFLASQNCTDLILTDWASSSSDESARTRQIRYTKNLTGMVGPKCVYVTENQTIHVDGGDGRVYVVECEASNGGVPYSENFVVRTRFCICRRAEDQCHITVHSSCVFVKSTWAITRNFIEKPVMQGLDEYFRNLNKYLDIEQEKIQYNTKSASPPKRKSQLINLDPSDESDENQTHTLRLKKRSTLHTTTTTVGEPPNVQFNQYEWLVKAMLVFMCFMLLLNALLLMRIYFSNESERISSTDCSTSVQTLASLLAHSQDSDISSSAATWLQSFTQQRLQQVLQSLSTLENQIEQLKTQLSIIQDGKNGIQNEEL